MELLKETKSFGLPAESQYGYVQGVKVGRNIYISGQLSHDEEGNIVGAAPLDDSGHIADHSNMKVQMQQAYVNAQRVLAQFGATLYNVIEEVLYVTDMDQALAVAGPVRREAYGVAIPQVASTILVTPRLAYRNQLIEIKFVAMHGLDIR
jgi:enamine deaminase RidA (YjgF/YER057c/UK114 family)